MRPVVDAHADGDADARAAARGGGARRGRGARVKVAILGGTGSFGRALAQRLAAVGEDDVVIGSRDAGRARETAAELGGATGATNEDAVRGADLVVLAVKAEARSTRRAESPTALGETPLLSVASAIRFAKGSARSRIPTRSASPSGCRTLVAAPVAPACTRSPPRTSTRRRREEDALVCGDDADAKELALELAGKLVAGRALDAGPLASARALEGLTAVIVNLNRRYKAHAGVRITGRRMISIIPVHGLPEIRAATISPRSVAERAELEDHDVLVLAQKGVSKSEGRVVHLDGDRSLGDAVRIAAGERDPREVEVILARGEARSCASGGRS